MDDRELIEMFRTRSEQAVSGGYETVGSTTEVEYERRFFGTVLDIADISAVTVRGTEYYKR